MKKYLWFLSFISIIGCDYRLTDPFGGASSQKTLPPPELNEQFAVPIGQTVTLQNEGLSIRFDSVPMDCRCPNGAVCIWQGYIEVILQATDSEKRSAEIRLSTLNGDQNVIASFFSYNIELLGLIPHPVVDRQTDTTAYQVLLIVKKQLTNK